jgi:heme oxygenase (biliverdin-IX-beta and delta-forming)
MLSGARGVLRDATAAVHTRLHRAAPFAALADGRLNRRGYATLLGSLLAFHRAVAPGTLRGRAAIGDRRDRGARLARLEADLAHLGGAPIRSIAAPAWNDNEAVGCLYVVEGSMLGGKLIHRQLDYLFGRESAGRSFFGGTADDGRRWRELCDRLETYGATDDRLAAMASGAVATFALFETCLDAAA